MWLITKHKETGELQLVTRFVREKQVEMWIINCMTVPSIVYKNFRTLEQAENFMKVIMDISNEINNILETSEDEK